MPAEGKPGPSRHPWVRRASIVHRRAARWPAAVRALLWSGVSGLLFVILNTVMRQLAAQLAPFEMQFLRYFAAILVLLPFMLRSGFAAYRPKNLAGQLARGAVHAAALAMWFLSLAHITLADTTAIGFTTPIFVMVGAALVFREPMRWERWVAASVGFAGVLIVVAPQLGGSAGRYALLMLASAPVFATSFMMTKALTRYERTEVIVLWQAIGISICSLPLALMDWHWPTATQWALVLLCGVLGNGGQYCLTQSFNIADLSATQSVKFLDLVWAAIAGWLVFGDVPHQTTILGGVVIAASTLWIVRREARGRAPS